MNQVTLFLPMHKTKMSLLIINKPVHVNKLCETGKRKAKRSLKLQLENLIFKDFLSLIRWFTWAVTWVTWSGAEINIRCINITMTWPRYKKVRVRLYCWIQARLLSDTAAVHLLWIQENHIRAERINGAPDCLHGAWLHSENCIHYQFC